MDLGASNLTNTRFSAPPTRVNQANQSNQSNQTSQSARQAALSQATANIPVPAQAVASVAVPGSAPQASGGGTTAPTQAGVRSSGVQTLGQQVTTAAMAMANAFSATFMAATGAIVMGANKKKASDISGDSKEGEGNVELETESEGQLDALAGDSNQEDGAGEVTQAGKSNGPST